MSMQSSAMPDSPLNSQVAARMSMSAVQPFLWSVRRELMEYRSLYIVPLAVAVIFVLAFTSHEIALRYRMPALHDAAVLRTDFEDNFMMASGFMMIVSMIVGTFYSLDALYGERRDRSILFWKSMPVSDLTTVLSKAIIPVVVLQLIAWAGTITLWAFMLALSRIVWSGTGISTMGLWSNLPFFPLALLLFYHLLFLHGLWHAPFYAWMLMVSSWARRAPILWAILPPAAIGVVERVAFSSSDFTNLLLDHLMGSPGSAPQEHGLMGMLGHFEPGTFLTPALWIGLALTALFLAAAVRLRRNRGPI